MVVSVPSMYASFQLGFKGYCSYGWLVFLMEKVEKIEFPRTVEIMLDFYFKLICLKYFEFEFV